MRKILILSLLITSLFTNNIFADDKDTDNAGNQYKRK